MQLAGKRKTLLRFYSKSELTIKKQTQMYLLGAVYCGIYVEYLCTIGGYC